MNTQAVDAAIRERIWPALAEAGFNVGKSRSAMRDLADRVDVVVIESVGRGAARHTDYTPSSFCVFAGVYLKYIPAQGAHLPDPTACQVRTSLHRGYFDFMEPRTIWRIDTAGKRLPKAIEDARRAILSEGEAWFGQFSTPQAVYELFSRPECDFGPWFEPTDLDAPIRRFMLGYAARAAGRFDVAQENLLKAADSGCFPNFSHQLRRDAQGA
jgi:hypothetical protein